MSFQSELEAIEDRAERHEKALRIITHLDPDEYGTTGYALACNLIANLALRDDAP